MSGVLALLSVLIAGTVCLCLSSILYFLKVRLSVRRAFTAFSYFFAVSLFSVYFARDFLGAYMVAERMIPADAATDIRVFIGFGLGSHYSEVSSLVFVLAMIFGAIAVCIKIIFSAVGRILPRLSRPVCACAYGRAPARVFPLETVSEKFIS